MQSTITVFHMLPSKLRVCPMSGQGHVEKNYCKCLLVNSYNPFTLIFSIPPIESPVQDWICSYFLAHMSSLPRWCYSNRRKDAVQKCFQNRISVSFLCSSNSVFQDFPGFARIFQMFSPHIFVLLWILQVKDPVTGNLAPFNVLGESFAEPGVVGQCGWMELMLMEFI